MRMDVPFILPSPYPHPLLSYDDLRAMRSPGICLQSCASHVSSTLRPKFGKLNTPQLHIVNRTSQHNTSRLIGSS